MEQRFFTRQQFSDDFGKEMVSADDVDIFEDFINRTTKPAKMWALSFYSGF